MDTVLWVAARLPQWPITPDAGYPARQGRGTRALPSIGFGIKEAERVQSDDETAGSGSVEIGIVRVLALPGDPYFFATLSVPMARSASGDPHSLVTAFAAAAGEHALASA
jgi:hypothetical protein